VQVAMAEGLEDRHDLAGHRPAGVRRVPCHRGLQGRTKGTKGSPGLTDSGRQRCR
jgi:hypothetical protein